MISPDDHLTRWGAISKNGMDELVSRSLLLVSTE